MALNKDTLAENLKLAHILAFNTISSTEDGQRILAENMSIAIHQYLIQAEVKTIVEGDANGGVNASTVAPSPGPIVVPAKVIAQGEGYLE